MRGHPYRSSRSLRIHSISCAAIPSACLPGSLLVPLLVPLGVASSTFSHCVPLLVPSVVRLVSRPASPARSLPLAYFPSVSHRHGSRLVSPPAPLLSSLRPIAPPIVSRDGETSPCLPLSCGEVRVRAASLPLSCGAYLLAWLDAVLAYLNAFPVIF